MVWALRVPPGSWHLLCLEETDRDGAVRRPLQLTTCFGDPMAAGQAGVNLLGIS